MLVVVLGSCLQLVGVHGNRLPHFVHGCCSGYIGCHYLHGWLAGEVANGLAQSDVDMAEIVVDLGRSLSNRPGFATEAGQRLQGVHTLAGGDASGPETD
jgi:hypothetical protein